MLIKVKKEVEETLEVKTPCWYVSKSGMFAHITKEGDLIKVGKGCIVLWDKENPLTQGYIREVVTEFHGSTEFQFKEALDGELFKLKETYTRA